MKYIGTNGGIEIQTGTNILGNALDTDQVVKISIDCIAWVCRQNFRVVPANVVSDCSVTEYDKHLITGKSWIINARGKALISRISDDGSESTRDIYSGLGQTFDDTSTGKFKLIYQQDINSDNDWYISGLAVPQAIQITSTKLDGAPVVDITLLAEQVTESNTTL